MSETKQAPIMDIYSLVLPIHQLQTPIEDDAQEFAIYLTYQDAKEIIPQLQELMNQTEKDAEQERKESSKSDILIPTRKFKSK